MKKIEHVWPLTIIADRYSGVYSGAKFLAFNLYEQDIPDGPSGNDNACGDFWEYQDHHQMFIIGKGSTPDEAFKALKKQLEQQSGFMWNKNTGDIVNEKYTAKIDLNQNNWVPIAGYSIKKIQL